MNTHPWCSDIERDAAVRAAEDAAAKERTPLPDHRELPERVARLEAAVFASQRPIVHIDTDETIDERVVAEQPAERNGSPEDRETGQSVTKSQSESSATEETSHRPLLTAEERAAVRAFLPRVHLNNPILDGHAAALRGLLARAGGA